MSYGDDWNNLKNVDYSNVKNLVEVKKDFYTENEKTKNRSTADIHKWRKENDIKIDDPSCKFRPVMEFSELKIPKQLSKVFQKNNFKNPTPIQAQSWPISLRGQDTIGIARTGSGKTLSFLMPAMIHISAQEPLKKNDGPICLVLTPTRELAQQVQDEGKKFGYAMKVRTTAVYGGVPKWNQKRALSFGSEIVVACPGRLLDFVQSNVINLHRVSFLILDEADRMLDMGFEPSIRKIVGQIRKDRQTLMFSATWPKEVRNLAKSFLSNPEKITIGSTDSLQANPKIKQIVEVVEESEKKQKFTKFIELAYQDKVPKTIVFTETKRSCDYLADDLWNNDWSVAAIHGDKEQKERDRTLKDFRSGKVPILIATDVAARGLDINDVEFVINYDFPSNVEDYVHRIGRTARAEKSGTAYTLLTRKKAKFVNELVEVMEKAEQEVPDEVRALAKRGERNGGGRFSRFGGAKRNGGGQKNRWRNNKSKPY